MKYLYIFLIIITFRSYGQQARQAEKAKSKGSIAIAEQKMLDWKKHQDSVRDAILQQKESKVLKESFLQEMYIRDAASVSKGDVSVAITFDLHGNDCGAPDYYFTDVSFSFKLGDTLIFPKQLKFQEHESGCAVKESRLSGFFKLMELTEKHVIYHSIKHKRTLVLFSSYTDNGTMAYYFTDVGTDTINGKNLFHIIKNYDDNDPASIYPFRSRALTTNEYEHFIAK